MYIIRNYYNHPLKSNSHKVRHRKLKRTLFLFIVSFILVNCGCQQSNSTNHYAVDDRMKQILFFSDEENLVEEAAYYDAFIDLKDDFPNEINNLQVLTQPEDKHHYAAYNITNCPTVIVMFNDDIVLQLSGKKKKEEIVKPLQEVLANND